MSGLLKSYIGQGLLADRPDAATLAVDTGVEAGVGAAYFATDTSQMFALDPGTPEWVEIGAGSGGDVACFAADMGGVDQTGFSTSSPTKVMPTNAVVNVGGFYDAGECTWTPPAGPVRISATVFMYGTIVTGYNSQVQIWKNGSLLYQTLHNSANDQSGITTTCVDVANGSDYYEMFCLATPSGSYKVHGGTGFTHFEGNTIATGTSSGGHFVAFAAGKGGTTQSGITPGTDTLVTFATEEYDEGGHYDASISRWTPPAGKVQTSMGVWIGTGLDSDALVMLQLFKNGVVMRQTLLSAGGSGKAGLQLSTEDTCDGTDYYEVFFYASGGAGVEIGASSAYSFWTGEVFVL